MGWRFTGHEPMLLGDYRVEIIPDTEFHLDGGAMFGVVPRTLWSKVSPPDDHNRIRMNMNCLFVDTGKEKVLLETGIGEKWSSKQTDMYGITRKHSLSETLKAKTGHATEDITIVVNTHLHFDHAGGNTKLEDGAAVPAFPNARYLVGSAELDHAESPSERDQASYLPDNWRPLRATGQLEARPAHYEVVPGLSMETYPGHNRSMQCWRLTRGGKTLFGFADLIPMQAHVRLPWIMGYDLYPTETLDSKKKLLPQALNNGWICHLYHEPDHAWFRMVEEAGKIVPKVYEE